MNAFPHHYKVSSAASRDSDVNLTADGLDAIVSAPPLEFGGPGDKWSPETLLVAAVADCFVLTFKAIARASKLDWQHIQCDVTGDLDRVENKTQFTALTIKADLVINDASKETLANRLLHKSEDACLITNSLNAATTLAATVKIAD